MEHNSKLEQLEFIEKQQSIILEDILSIKEQISRAKARVYYDGKYSNPDWYIRANKALRYKQMQHQQLLKDGASIRKEIKKEHDADDRLRFERAFFIAASKFLDEKTFKMLLNIASTSSAEFSSNSTLQLKEKNA